MFPADHHSQRKFRDHQPSHQEPGEEMMRNYLNFFCRLTLFPLMKNCKSAAGFERSDQHSTMASWPSETTDFETLILGLPFSG